MSGSTRTARTLVEALRPRIAAGDVPMRDVFALAKEHVDLDLGEIESLLEESEELVRVAAVSVMDFQARRRSTPEERRSGLYELYLRRHDRIDRWDMVDRAAPSVVGDFLVDRPRDPLYDLARHPGLYERRTAITATWAFLRRKQVDDTFAIAALLADDDRHFVQTAVGSWLRDAGKQDPDRLRRFLDEHAPVMSAIAVRFAVEKLEPEERKHYRDLRRGAD